MTYDVCCVGNWSGYNYGAHLTHYALFSTLCEKGLKVLMLEKPNVKPYPPLNVPKLFKNNPYSTGALSPLYNRLTEMRMINNICDSFIVGSDQLWNYDLFGHSMPFYALSFVNSGKRKVSYSTSLGHVPFDIPYEKRIFMKTLLKRFDMISIRENDGIEFCKTAFNITPDVTLDPVFLCKKNVYYELMEKSTLVVNDKFIFAYIIHFTERKASFLKKIKKLLGLRIICIGDALISQNTFGIDVVKNASVEDWLRLLNESELVVTDSYHAYCFSVIFGKNVMPIHENMLSMSRVLSLSNFIGSSRPILLDDSEANLDAGIICLQGKNNYVRRLQDRIDFSMEWLENSLKAEPKEDDDISEQIICMGNQIWELEIANQ